MPNAPTQALRLDVVFTRYDEGSAAARFVLIGLGQIPIEATVTLTDETTNQRLGEYKVSKQFALGGIAGATTDMSDVEEGEAKSVVEIFAPKEP